MTKRALKCPLGVPHNNTNPTRETLFKLAFDTEAMILAEVRHTSLKMDHYNEESNDKELRINLDLLDEIRIGVEQRLAQY